MTAFMIIHCNCIYIFMFSHCARLFIAIYLKRALFVTIWRKQKKSYLSNSAPCSPESPQSPHLHAGFPIPEKRDTAFALMIGRVVAKRRIPNVHWSILLTARNMRLVKHRDIYPPVSQTRLKPNLIKCTFVLFLTYLKIC